MSTPADELTDDEAGRTGRARLVLRAFSAVAALVSLLVLWSGERVQVPHDLQIVAQPNVRPGDTLAVRAFVLRNVEAPEGPTLVRKEVALRLLDAEGRELARTVLRPTALEAMEGAIRVPGTASGPLVLEGTAKLDDALPLVCRRAVSAHRGARGLATRGREAGPLQQFALGTIKRIGLTPPPEPFSPRVLGGACVPEQRCTILVWVGQPAASITVRPSPALTLVGEPLPATETSGLVELTVRVHGIEAELVLEARRGNEPVAQLPVRLPVALGDVAVLVDKPVLDDSKGARIALALPPGREHAIVDVYSEGHLRASRTFANVVAEQPLAWDAPLLAPGLSRIQARVDRFSAEGAGSRMVYVREPGESDAYILRKLARIAAEEGFGSITDRWVKELPSWAQADLQRTAAYVLAPLEAQRAEVPPAVSGRPSQVARVEHAKKLARFGVSALLVVAALFVGASLMRRGLHASEEASAILAEARSGEAPGSGERPPGDLLRVVALTLAVVLAFLAGALLIASKSLWF